MAGELIEVVVNASHHKSASTRAVMSVGTK
jgi:hypothetical protein